MKMPVIQMPTAEYPFITYVYRDIVVELTLEGDSRYQVVKGKKHPILYLNGFTNKSSVTFPLESYINEKKHRPSIFGRHDCRDTLSFPTSWKCRKTVCVKRFLWMKQEFDWAETAQEYLNRVIEDVNSFIDEEYEKAIGDKGYFDEIVKDFA